MKKFILAICLIVILPLGVFAQSPLSGTGLWLYEETDGYCIVEGYGRLHYWLYNTYENMNGNSDDLVRAFVNYVEKLGWTIDYDNATVYSPNDSLAKSVKLMMLSKNSDMSMTIIEYNKKSAALYINNHDVANDLWETLIFPLIK
jgi:hypothetical protein